jgi:hypothetical protein
MNYLLITLINPVSMLSLRRLLELLKILNLMKLSTMSMLHPSFINITLGGLAEKIELSLSLLTYLSIRLLIMLIGTNTLNISRLLYTILMIHWLSLDLILIIITTEASTSEQDLTLSLLISCLKDNMFMTSTDSVWHQLSKEITYPLDLTLSPWARKYSVFLTQRFSKSTDISL